jgi:alanyl-tRNA synthetase
MSAREIIDIYISFFEKRGHKRIPNSPLVPIDDPTTLFTSSGMQPLVPYLLGEQHPSGTRIVDVQNCFRAVDIDEVGDNRHTTFFRMLGNWSLGDYFKSEEIPWLWEFLTVGLELPKEKLYITVFKGYKDIGYDKDTEEIWREVLAKDNVEPKIFADDTNWWSRSGPPDKMPAGELGGPDTEVYYRFDDVEHTNKCQGDDPTKCVCGKFLEIANSVFMQYIKTEKGFEPLPKQNVDFGGGLERLLAAVEDKSDIFTTSLFLPIIEALESESGKSYKGNENKMRIVIDHLRASAYLIDSNVLPSNKERGYILRRLIRRCLDNLEKGNIENIVEAIVKECSKTDESLNQNFEEIKNVILEEETKYKTTQKTAKDFIIKKYGGRDDSAQPVREIEAEDAFLLYSTHGLSPTQIKSLGYIFDEQKFANLMEAHSKISKTASSGMFKGGLADHSEQTIKGHTATHLLHQALRDIFGTKLHQTGSNITSERVRFDFNFDRNLTDEEIKKVEEIVNGKIKENLPVHFEMIPLNKAKEIGAIGLFDEKYAKDVKVYFIGDYSKEFCGGPHVNFTGEINRFKIIKQENLGKGQKRIYAKVGE